MLSALLPGVREFRTPLVTGVLWAICIWLLGGVSFVDHSSTRHFITRFRLDELPSAGAVAAAALAVYLFGSLLVVRESPFSWIERRYGWRLRHYAQRLESDDPPSKVHRRWVWK